MISNLFITLDLHLKDKKNKRQNSLLFAFPQKKDTLWVTFYSFFQNASFLNSLFAGNFCI